MEAAPRQLLGGWMKDWILYRCLFVSVKTCSFLRLGEGLWEASPHGAGSSIRLNSSLPLFWRFVASRSIGNLLPERGFLGRLRTFLLSQGPIPLSTETSEILGVRLYLDLAKSSFKVLSPCCEPNIMLNIVWYTE